MRTMKYIPLLVILLVIMACAIGRTVAPTPDSTDPTVQPPAQASPTVEGISEPRVLESIEPLLEELGGQPCEENPDFTCVTIQVPLDHFDPANPETIEVVFAVLPAFGERYGMFLQAFPGGPGGEGISTGFAGFHSPDIEEHYDIIFFDQRGVGLSNPLECPSAYAADFLNYLSKVDQGGEEGYDLPQEQQEAIADAQLYVDSCMAEIGLQSVNLEFYGTDQVAEDIESFRQVVGDEKFMFYGVSYGTSVVQHYAAVYPQHLAGMVLDGTLDLTLTGEQGAFSQEAAFDKVLVAVLNACTADPACAADVGGNALAAYDAIAAQASAQPIAYEFPLPDGTTVSRDFTFNQLEYTTAYQMYSLSGRMLFLRALAAAVKGDPVPLARLQYQQLTLDPATYQYLGDPSFSDTMFLNVLCADDSFFPGTIEEKLDQVIEAGQASNGTVPRLDGSVYTGLTCAFMPFSPTEVVTKPPLVAEGVPAFVLNATMDPATPFEEGKKVYENLADGYHLYVEGGRHSIYGWGYDCPDQYITDFLVDGSLPEQREILCEDWGTDVIRAYEPLPPADAASFADPLEAFQSFETEMSLQPEYFYGYFEDDVTVTCSFGGTFTFGPSDTGEAFTFDQCAYTKGFAVSGAGGYDYGSGIFNIDADVSGLKSGALQFVRDDNAGTYTLTGEYGGQPVELTQ